jgi:hypothetical protein
MLTNILLNLPGYEKSTPCLQKGWHLKLWLVWALLIEKNYPVISQDVNHLGDNTPSKNDKIKLCDMVLNWCLKKLLAKFVS